MTNKERQKSLDKKKWLASERTGWDRSGAELYCDYCARQKINMLGDGTCTATQAERESECFCAKAYNFMLRRLNK